MTIFTNVFGGQTLPPSNYRYNSVTLTADTTFYWPENSDGSNLLATIMDVNASVGSLSLKLPSAQEVSNGRDALIRNTGANTFSVKDNGGSVIASIDPGVVKYIYLIDNSTAAGSWSVFTFGTGISAADASALAGNGLLPVGGTLSPEYPSVSSSASATVQSTDRAKVIVFSSSGAVSCTLPNVADIGDGFFFLLSNQGTGTVTVSGDANVDGAASKAVAPTESCLFILVSTEWISVGYGRSATFAFTQLVKDISAGGSFTLSAGEYANKLMRFIGAAPSNVTIIVPSAAAVYYVQCAYTGAYTLTVKTAAGTGVAMSNSDRSILLCDGTDVVVAQSTSVTAPTSVPDGSAAAPALYFAADTNTGFFRAGTDTFGVAGGGAELFRVGPSEMLLAVALNLASGSKATTRSNLGLAIGSDVQAYDAFLNSIAALGTAADRIIYTTGINVAAEAVLTSFARTLLDDTSASAACATLGARAIADDVTLAAGKKIIFEGTTEDAFELTVDPGEPTADRTQTHQDANGLIGLVGLKEQIGHWPAGALKSQASNGCDILAWSESTTNKVMVGYLAFDSAAIEYAQFSFRAPKAMDESGAFTAIFEWMEADSATSHDCVWQIEMQAQGDGDTIDSAWGTAISVTDTGSAGSRRHTAETGSISPAGTWVAGDDILVRVSRKATDVADTLNVDAKLIGVTLFATFAKSGEA